MKLFDLLSNLSRFSFVELEYIHLLVEQMTVKSDVDRSLDFISCQHPEFHAGITYRAYGLAHLILQLIFYCCASDQTEVALHFLGDLVHSLLSVRQTTLSLHELSIPVFILDWVNFFLREKKRTKAFICILV